MDYEQAAANGLAKFLEGMNGHLMQDDVQEAFALRFKSRLGFYAPTLTVPEIAEAEARALQIGQATAAYATRRVANVIDLLKATYDVAEASRLAQPAPHAPTKLC